MVRKLLLILILFQSTLIYCQSDWSGQQFAMGDNTYRGIFKPMQYKLTYEDIDGSPYYNDELIKGLVIFRIGDSLFSYMRYNVYEDAVEYVKEEVIYNIANPQSIDHIIIGTEKFVYTVYVYDNKPNKGYLIKCLDGKIQLYKKPVITYKEPVDPLTSYHQAQPPTFVLDPTVWLIEENGQIVVLEVSKSNLSTIMGKDYSKVDTYRKKEKLKLKRDDDVIKLFKYYNSL